MAAGDSGEQESSLERRLRRTAGFPSPNKRDGNLKPPGGRFRFSPQTPSLPHALTGGTKSGSTGPSRDGPGPGEGWHQVQRSESGTSPNQVQRNTSQTENETYGSNKTTSRSGGPRPKTRRPKSGPVKESRFNTVYPPFR